MRKHEALICAVVEVNAQIDYLHVVDLTGGDIPAADVAVVGGDLHLGYTSPLRERTGGEQIAPTCGTGSGRCGSARAAVLASASRRVSKNIGIIIAHLHGSMSLRRIPAEILESPKKTRSPPKENLDSPSIGEPVPSPYRRFERGLGGMTKAVFDPHR